MRVRVVHQGEVSTIPLLSEAYSDAHLNVDTLDKDIARVEKKLATAVKRFEKILTVKVNLDDTAARRKLADLGVVARQVRRDLGRPVRLDVTVDPAEAAAAGVEAHAAAEAAAGDVHLGTTLDSQDAFNAILRLRTEALGLEKRLHKLTLGDGLQASLDAIRSRLQEIAQEGLALDLQLNQDGLKQLGALLTLLSRIDGTVVQVGIELNGAGAIGEAGSFSTALDLAARDLVIDTRVEGGPAAIAELKAIGAAADSVNDVDLDFNETSLTDIIDTIRSRMRGIWNLAGQDGIDTNVLRQVMGAAIGDVAAAMQNFGDEGVTGTERVRAAFADLGATIDGVTGNAGAKLARLGDEMSGLFRRQRSTTFVVDVDGVATAITKVESLGDLFKALPRRLRTRFDLDGGTEALAEASGIRAALAAIPNKVRTVLDTDVSWIDRLRLILPGRGQGGGSNLFTRFAAGAQDALSGLGETASEVFAGFGQSAVNGVGKLVSGLQSGLSTLGQFGQQLAEMGGKLTSLVQAVPGLGAALGAVASAAAAGVAAIAALGIAWTMANAMGALATAIAAAVAWLVPLATGLVGAAAGLLAVAAAAPVAVGALAGLSVMFDPAAMANVKTQFSQFKNFFTTAFAESLAPVQSLILDEFLPGLFGAIGPVMLQLAPFASDMLRPITDALLSLVPLLGQLGPVAVVVGDGVGRLIDMFGRFAAAVDMGVVLQQVKSLMDGLVATMDLLGQAGLAFMPALTAILDGFHGLVQSSIGPFTEIISTFAAALPGIGDAISNILTPLGSLAVTFGQAVAAIGPHLDNLFGLVQAVVPTLNFEVMQTALERIVPTIAQFLDEIGPAVESIGRSWVTFTEELLTDTNLDAMKQIASALVAEFAVFMDLLAQMSPLISAVFQGALRTIQGFLVGVNLGRTVLFGFMELLVQIVDFLGETLGKTFEIGGKMLGWIPGFDGAGKAVAGFGTALQDAADSSRDWLSEARRGSWEATKIAAGGESAAKGLEGLNANTRAGAKDLAEYSEKLETVYGTLELTGPAARKLAGEFARLRKQFPTTMAAIADSAKLFTDGNLLKDGAARQKQALDTASKSMTDSAKGAAGDVKAAFGGAQLSSFFVIPDGAVEDTQAKAKGISDTLKEFLGQARLSEFIQGSERSVTRSLDRLVRSMQQKLENIGRLKLIESMGFTDLAAQLASLDANPAVLGKFISQLFSAGTGEMSKQNARLAGLRKQLEAGYGGLGPAVSAAIGDRFGDDAAKKVEKGNSNINEALDDMVADVRTKASNIRRVAALDQMGFGDLADALASLNSDPKALKAALDQLAAGGVSAYQAANAKLAGAQAEVIAAAGGLDEGLAQAFGFPDKTTAAIDGQAQSIWDALDGAAEILHNKTRQIEAIFKLEQGGLGALAEQFKNLDPETAVRWFDELSNQGLGAFQMANAKLKEEMDKSQALIASYDPLLAAAASSWPGLTVAELQKKADEIRAALSFLPDVSAKGVWDYLTKKEARGETPDTGEVVNPLTVALDEAFGALKASAVEMAGGLGTDYIDALAGAVRQGSAAGVASISESVTDIFGGLGIVPATMAGVDMGAEFLNELTAGISDGGIQVSAGIHNLFVTITGSAKADAATEGGLIGLTFANAVSLGFTLGAVSMAVDVQALTASMVDGVDSLLDTRGLEAGAGFAEAISLGFTAGSLRLAATIQDLLRSATQGLATSQARRFTDTGAYLGAAMGQGIGTGLAVSMELVKLQAVLLAAGIDLAVRQTLGINSPSTVGRTLGQFFGDGLAQGLTETSLVPAAQSLAESASAAVEASLAPTSILGTGFAGAIASGMLAGQGAVRGAADALAAQVTAGFQPAAVIPAPTVPAVAVAPAWDQVTAEQAALAAMQAAQPVAATPADPQLAALLAQILTAIQGIDATTDPAVIAMLQQLLASANQAPTAQQRTEMAAAAKLLVGR